jgi:hypothetical protein
MKKLGQLVGSGLAALALIGVMAFLVSIGDKILMAIIGGGSGGSAH